MPVIKSVEISELDLRYESFRMKHPKKEERLLHSMIRNGIRDPLKGVCLGETHCLLDGFKRIRCARKLAITIVPYHSLGNDEAMGLIELMRESFKKPLNVIEQIQLINALKTGHGLSNHEIAAHLDKSNAWVSVRVAMYHKLTPLTARCILSGKFPARSYLYGILPFTRVNKIKPEEIERFVERVGGNDFSTRDINQLAAAYFKGTSELREQIEEGNPKWALQCLKHTRQPKSIDATPLEQTLLKSLETVHAGMLTINRHHTHPDLQSSAFLAQAGILTKGILDTYQVFIDAVGRLYDRSQ